jgi:DNA-binding HxlR family transcriptional regulator
MKNSIECPAERAIYFLGGKWKIRILFTLYTIIRKLDLIFLREV